MIFAVYTIVLFCLMTIYVRIAKYYNINDNPNSRSSHSIRTLRGGGIIFPISLLLNFLHSHLYHYFIIGLILIAVISFIDDIYTLSPKVRILIHLISVSFLFYENNLFTQTSLIFIIPAFIIVIGIINAYNFMDGINGITALYSLVLAFTLLIINRFLLGFIQNEIFIPIISSLIIFGTFNIRKRALVFAGDVGSVSIAFTFSFLLLALILKTHSLVWIFFLSLYGIDAIVTIILRLIRKENIFNSHRSHFYQFLTNDLLMGHINVSILYSLIQVLINAIVVYSYYKNNYAFIMIAFFGLLILYTYYRFTFEGKKRLLVKY